MKISQNFTRQEITPSDAKLNWIEHTHYFWLFIMDGLGIRKYRGGSIVLVIHDSLDPRHLNCFYGNLHDKTTGIVTPIVPPMNNFPPPPP